MALNKSLIVEIWYPFAGAVVLSILSHVFEYNIFGLEDLPTTVITITAIFVGFISTLAGLLLSSESKGISKMKQLDKYSITLKYCWRAVRLSFLLILINVVLIIYPKIDYHWASTLWTFLTTWTYLSIFRGVDVALSAINQSAKG